MRAPRCDAARGGRRCATRKARGPGGRHGKRRPRRERGGGAQLNYDNEGRLVSWENAPSSPTTSTDAFASDGEGSRIAQKAVSNGVTTTTDYLLGGLEEVTGGGSGTLTEYYSIPGIGTAVRVGSTLSYLASDNLGSVTVALSSSGTVTAQQLYGPYGSVRYSSGTMPTAHGYTGQIADAATGLSYYGARYYDPSLGQFASADSVLAGLNRYAYVGGNPTTATSTSGHVEEAVQQIEAGAEDGTDLANSAGTGVPAVYYQAFAGDSPLALDPTATVTDGNVTTTYTDDGNGVIQANTATTTSTGTSYTTSWLKAASGGYSTAYYALNNPADAGVAAKIKGAYAPTSSGQPKHKPTPPTPPNPGPGPGPTPATQTGSGGANGGAGTTPPTGSCGCYPDESGGDGSDILKVYLSISRYPETTQHIRDAIAAGHPSILTWAPELADLNRQASLAGWPTRDGFDRDEYPLAATREGGAGADIRYVRLGDNRGAGARIANQLRGVASGTRFTIVFCP